MMRHLQKTVLRQCQINRNKVNHTNSNKSRLVKNRKKTNRMGLVANLSHNPQKYNKNRTAKITT